MRLSTSPRRSETRRTGGRSPCGSPLLGFGDQNETLAQPCAEEPSRRNAEVLDRRQGRHGPALAPRLCRVKSWTIRPLSSRVVQIEPSKHGKILVGTAGAKAIAISRSGLDCVGAPQRRGRAGPGSRLAAKHVVVGLTASFGLGILAFLSNMIVTRPVRALEQTATHSNSENTALATQLLKIGRGGARCDLFFQAGPERQDILQLCGREHEGDMDRTRRLYGRMQHPS